MVVSMSQIRDLLTVDDDLKKLVRNSYEKSEDDIKQDLDILYSWWGKQPHLPKINDDDALEKTLMRNKFRIEQTKRKLDAYFSLRGLYSDFFDIEHAFSETVRSNFRHFHYFFPLKAPTSNGERVYFYKINENISHDRFDVKDFFYHVISLYEVVNKYDYCSASRFISDVQHLQLTTLTKVDPVSFYRGMKIIQEGLSSRIAAVEYFNAPTYIGILLKLFKPAVKEGKLGVYDSIDDFCEIYPKECLPDEYGGKAGKMDDLQDAWDKELLYHKDWLLEKSKQVSDEKLRPGKSQYDDLFGVDGTFKKINLD